MQCIGFSEIDPPAINVYQRHFPKHKNWGNVAHINPRELPAFELLVGGFPCQAFSIAGKRQGFSDSRGNLFFEIARIIRQAKPRLLLLENVKGLLSHDQGETFYRVIATLDEMGYDCQWQVLNSKHHRVPQNRERIFIVGHRRGTPRPCVFPFTENDTAGNEKCSSRLLGHQVASTLTCRYAGGSGSHILASEPPALSIRRLSPVECERLQGFPDYWTAGLSMAQRYKALGNAVTVSVIQTICEALL